jgi:putative flippase GtrA
MNGAMDKAVLYTMQAPMPASPSVAPTRPRGLKLLVRSTVAAVGCIAVEFGLLTVFVSHLHMHYLLATVLAGVVYLFLNFFLNRRWAFEARHGSPLPQLLRHGFVILGGIALGCPLLWVSVSVLGLTYRLGWAASGAIAYLAWTFPMHKHFTYRQKAALQLARA